jgi:DNA mismatch repair ATPase MutS
VVIDELGRGTSTFDGMAIAEAVLDHLLFVLKPTTLFSTHYTQITHRYANAPQVRLAKMGYEIEEGRLQFTYQLRPGVAEKSFACNVAKMVGIPPSILQRADLKSDQMHHETNRKKLLREACRLAGLLSQTPAPEDSRGSKEEKSKEEKSKEEKPKEESKVERGGEREGVGKRLRSRQSKQG